MKLPGVKLRLVLAHLIMIYGTSTEAFFTARNESLQKGARAIPSDPHSKNLKQYMLVHTAEKT